VSTTPLNEPIDVLAGRFTLPFFQGSTSGPPSWDVMSSPRPPEEATRIWLMVGGQPHVAMTFEERFATAGPSLEAAVGAFTRGDDDVRLVRIPTRDPALRVVGLAPRSCEPNDENAVVVLKAIVADAAGMITTVIVGVDASELGDCGACTDRMVEALGGLTTGRRTLDAPASERVLEGTRGGWRVSVPAGWTLVSQPGPDFVWHRIRKPAVFPNPPAIVAIYDGDPPDSDVPPDASETSRAPARVAGRNGEWTLWTRPLPTVNVYGAFLGTRPALPFVVQVLSTVEADRDAGLAIAASLRQ
jgi:hypothetical protein